MKLQKLKILSNTLYDLILNLRYFKFFDGKNLPKINNGILSLCLNNNIQVKNIIRLLFNIKNYINNIYIIYIIYINIYK